MKYQFPIKIQQGSELIISQPFRSKNVVDLSRALAVETTDHNGVDITCGTNEQTWGRECVWPFPWSGVVYDSRVSSEFGAKDFARCQIDTTDPQTTIRYSIIYLHLSSVTNTKSPTDDKIIVYRQGDVIGKIGNNGSVRPVPTPQRPLDGSHLHLGLGVKKPKELNYTMSDPFLYFDVTNPFRDSSVVLPPKELEPWEKLTNLGNQMMATNPVQARIVLLVANIVKAFSV